LISYIIKSGAHHLDLLGPNPADPEDVKSGKVLTYAAKIFIARELEIGYLKKWIKAKQDMILNAKDL